LRYWLGAVWRGRGEGGDGRRRRRCGRHLRPVWDGRHGAPRQRDARAAQRGCGTQVGAGLSIFREGEGSGRGGEGAGGTKKCRTTKCRREAVGRARGSEGAGDFVGSWRMGDPNGRRKTCSHALLQLLSSSASFWRRPWVGFAGRPACWVAGALLQDEGMVGRQEPVTRNTFLPLGPLYVERALLQDTGLGWRSCTWASCIAFFQTLAC
jgi:hypothetical protein